MISFKRVWVLAAGQSRRMLLAVLAGSVSGVSASLFMLLLDITSEQASGFHWYILFMPVSFFISRLLVERFAQSGDEGRNDRFLRVIHVASKKGAVKAVLSRLLASVITIASGGSAGRAGPSAQIGAAAASRLSVFLHLEGHEKQQMILCGVSGGFGAVFGVPFAGAFFAMEILRHERRQYHMIIPAAVSSLCAVLIARHAGISHHIIRIVPESPMGALLLMQALFGGVLFGMTGILMMYGLSMVRKACSAVPLSGPVKAGIGGVVLVFFSLLISREYLGLGSSVIDSLLKGGEADPLGFIYKIFTTSVTLGAGGTGGIITPILFVGSSAGSLLGQIMGADTAVFAALGIAAVLSSTANAPASSAVLAAELFGISMLPAAVCAAAVSYLVTKNRKISTGELLFFPKTISIL